MLKKGFKFVFSIFIPPHWIATKVKDFLKDILCVLEV